VAHIVKRCSRCRRRVPPGARACECGGRRIVWLARYRDPERVERSQVFERQQDAEDFLEGIEAAKDRGEFVNPRVGREMLASVYSRFSEDIDLAPTTSSKWATVWRLHVEPRLGATPVSKITKNAVIGTRDAPSSPWQGNEALKLVKRLLYFAVDDGILNRNVAARVKPRDVKRRPIEILEPDELNAVLDHLGDRWRAMVLLDAFGSLRWSELVGLRRQDLDLEARAVTITQKITEVNGTFHVGRPKTQGSARTVDLPAMVIKPLAEYLLRYPPSPDGLVFHGRGGNPVRRKVFRAAWTKGACRREDHEARPSRMAPTLGRKSRLRGEPGPETRQQEARPHTSIRMVDSSYVSLYEDASRAVADAIDELLSASGVHETDH
jgi:integrase